MINQFKPNRMKKNNFKKTAMTFLMVIIALANAAPLMAQQKSGDASGRNVKVVVPKKVQVDDKELVGTWVLQYLLYDDDKGKIMCNETYTQVKVYRANGEYACAEIAKSTDGSFQVFPHEYGTYSLKNGRYSEMGRPVVAEDCFVWVDKNTFRGRFFNRRDEWKKTKLPEKLVNYIVAQCKAKQEGDPKDIQEMIHQHLLNK